MNLSPYRTLGNSGLIVSPLALGTMTFGTGRWGTDEKTSYAIFNAYVEAGGNLIDTADIYSAGESEAMLGRFLAKDGNRERVVISSKSGYARRPNRPLTGGNSVRNIRDGI
jgi:aryl-alcohol dehydrogenase-like predicted oxidoreductase